MRRTLFRWPTLWTVPQVIPSSPFNFLLNSLPVASLPAAVALIAPPQISSITATGVSLGKVQISNIGEASGYIRAGNNGFSCIRFFDQRRDQSELRKWVCRGDGAGRQKRSGGLRSDTG